MIRPRRHRACARLRLVRAQGVLGRMRGLLCRARAPGPGSALLLSPCWAVHTVGMRYSIDVAFIDRQGRVLRLARNLRPGRLAVCVRAAAVLEMAVNLQDTPLRYRRRLHIALRRAGVP
ncbi:DUF192 domain-containing protein [Bordetella petrii]|uniref:DUF192 domain-containing protein n=1 Tax=Bordetella petrii TaxID=94624 RepID=UPI001E64A669|nr:DUF192 domain-containing protein [Bordetella petrii]MCD0501643.1 DUF192 domain-containing protein [Bordetella petrii]